MSTFYLLPPRPILGQRFAGYLSRLFPGLDWSRTAWGELGDILGGLVARSPDVYVVYGEELPPGIDAASALQDGFGAEEGDLVIELRPADQPGELTPHRWQIGEDLADD
jgi:hypothetical protein